MTSFSSIVVANRGEIACRIMRTASELGYRTVAVYSDVDAEAPHVQMADEAVCIGAGPVGESYLLGERIIAAAKETGAEAVHPGYGFLSENADFARACEAAGLVFIGPTADAIDLMGNKAEAKRRMIDAGVPCVPGYEGRDQADETLLLEAEIVGMPLMVKAAAGGGGRGMRLVHEVSELASAIKLARAEAENAFGSGELILERAIIRPRHVEVQVFADSHGNTVHLGERDCSVQRRHQKVVEEAPCPVMTPELRERMGAAAVEAACSIAYRGAGTVEFLLDEAGEFYFLEMNTRLQVEHPVTELVTGLDLVALQIQVAQGEVLGFEQADVQLKGHAIEVRLYTEDPAQDFLPTSGPVDLWAPASGPGIRIDSGIRSGQMISPFYDPMVAKVIACGANRELARRRLIEALRHTVLFGTANNKEFLVACLENERFAAGQATTAFIAEEFSGEDLAAKAPSLVDAAIAAVLEVELAFQQSIEQSVVVNPALKNWSSVTPLVSRKQYAFGETLFDLSVSPTGLGSYCVGDGESTVSLVVVTLEADRAHIAVEGAQHVARFREAGSGRLQLSVDGRSATYLDLVRLAGVDEEAGGNGRVLAPMHGLLLDVQVKTGDAVSKGQTLAVLEAMKMHYEILAEVDGTMLEVRAIAGKQVAAEDVLFEIEVAE